MKKINLILLILTVLTTYTSAQSKRETFRTRERVIDFLELAKPGVLYLFDDFREATVYYPGGRNTKQLVNYSLMQDIIISKNPQGTISMLSTRIQFDSVVVEKENMVFVWQRNQGYLDKAVSSTHFFIKHRTEYNMTEVKTGAYGASGRSASIENARSLIVRDLELPNYTNNISLENPVGSEVEVVLTYSPALVMVSGNELVSISSRRDLNRLFPDQRNELRDFLRKENISFDVRKDLIKLAAFLDSLL